MKLTVKNKLVSMGGSSTITNEKDEEVYFAKGKIASISHKKFLRDAKTKKKLFTIRNKVFHFVKRKAFIYNANKNLVATVIKRFKLKQEYDIEGATSKIEMIGSNFAWNFDILVDGKKEAHISRVLRATRADTFTVDINNPEDAAFMVALVIALDNITDAAKGEKK